MFLFNRPCMRLASKALLRPQWVTLVLCMLFLVSGCSRDDIATSTVSEQPESGDSFVLSVGSPAPELQVEQWVHGDVFEQPLNEGVQVVEFWATWCGPCLVNMPHLSELQEQYGDQVTFIGITAEDAGTVQDFLNSEGPGGETWSDIITYRLATDPDGDMHQAYMTAAGQTGIPTAFIIGRNGQIRWIGHPSEMDDPLRAVVEQST